MEGVGSVEAGIIAFFGCFCVFVIVVIAVVTVVLVRHNKKKERHED